MCSHLEERDWAVSHQEAGGVVQQAAEAAAEVPLQEGGVLGGDRLGVVGHDVGADLRRALLACGSGEIFSIYWIIGAAIIISVEAVIYIQKDLCKKKYFFSRNIH